MWDHDRVTERATHRLHAANANTLRWVPGAAATVACAASDGCVKLFDVGVMVESGELLNLNPGGWVPGVSSEKTWKVAVGLAALPGGSALLAGDSDGRIHVLDPRAPQGGGGCAAVHGKGKVNSVDVHPRDPSLVLTAGNDWTVRLSDVRGAAGDVFGYVAPDDEPRVGRVGRVPLGPEGG